MVARELTSPLTEQLEKAAKLVDRHRPCIGIGQTDRMNADVVTVFLIKAFGHVNGIEAGIPGAVSEKNNGGFPSERYFFSTRFQSCFDFSLGSTQASSNVR